MSTLVVPFTWPDPPIARRILGGDGAKPGQAGGGEVLRPVLPSVRRGQAAIRGDVAISALRRRRLLRA